ncbi:hypothetical protein CQ12_29015 [Bradyrhizobium jicamae]|uniref:Iminophenyl-pyruvate dimer synthase domain-containing protein n=1 Tax=Bradyrhizobium jicamae TaxID=280332 RepID=A0A0R3M7N3_9BRAD|nr:ferritin-like protein [Bradyrhizobium jicamae]KRR15993.1 hypothetical protein CQ12_29015 [Bradyrhizobium jicamae]
MMIRELMAVPDGKRGVRWLKESIRAAIKLEFATVPPYLTAMWSIVDPNDPVARTIREVVVEEMLHMGLMCNMMVALGETPALDAPDFVPSYPGALPGDVNPDLTIALRRLTPSQLKVFMDIEYPEGGPITTLALRTFETIGAFYAALLSEFEAANPTLDVTKQRQEPISGVFRMSQLADVRRAIDIIRHQGEGSKQSPEEEGMSGRLAHFYQFREVYIGNKYVRDSATMTWGHTGAPVLMPSVFPMADIPTSGYQQTDVQDSAVRSLIEQFDISYSSMLRQLRTAWEDQSAPLGDFSATDPIQTMFNLGPLARELMQKQIRPDNAATYGPCFRLVSR